MIQNDFVIVLSQWQLLTQICLALSALILRAVEDGKPVEKLFYSLWNLQSEDDDNVAVLEMLTVLPEELIDTQASDCNISSAHRSQYGQEVYNFSFRFATTILLFVTHCIFLSFIVLAFYLFVYFVWFAYTLFLYYVVVYLNSFSPTHLWFLSSYCNNLRKVLMDVFNCMKGKEKFCVAY